MGFWDFLKKSIDETTKEILEGKNSSADTPLSLFPNSGSRINSSSTSPQKEKVVDLTIGEPKFQKPKNHINESTKISSGNPYYGGNYESHSDFNIGPKNEGYSYKDIAGILRIKNSTNSNPNKALVKEVIATLNIKPIDKVSGYKSHYNNGGIQNPMIMKY